MDNNSAASFSGAQNTQFSQAQGNNGSKDPLDYYYKNGDSGKDGPSFWGTFIFHDQVQDTEMELQYLNATKSDFGGTSVGVSDAKLRFLGIKSYGIIKVSFVSLLLNFIIFAILFNFAGQLIGFVFSLVMFIHVFFPGHVIYGMKRFTTKNGRFTTKYLKKIKSIWRLFEGTFLLAIGGVAYLSTIDYVAILTSFQAGLTNKIFIKLASMVTSKVDFKMFQGMFQVYLLVMLIAFLFYIIMAYIRSKKSAIVQKEIEFEHNKEIKRPAELARIRMGKLK